jgi:hypothetical protein
VEAQKLTLIIENFGQACILSDALDAATKFIEQHMQKHPEDEKNAKATMAMLEKVMDQAGNMIDDGIDLIIEGKA